MKMERDRENGIKERGQDGFQGCNLSLKILQTKTGRGSESDKVKNKFRL